MHSISVVIPCYRDDSRLARLLTQLRQLTHPPLEIIVVDAADSLRCAGICRHFQARRIAAAPCRGKQLRLGAADAKGDVLWFVHADAQIPNDALTAITLAIAGGAIGGYFRFRFAGPRSRVARFLEYAIAIRCRFGGVPYGDQGLFMLRTAYREIGGHAPWPLFEEVPLIQAIRRIGRLVPVTEPIQVDAHRWQRDGWWRRTLQNRILVLRFICGASPQQLAAHYHSKSRV
ncbi:MAG: TIGR04283 family arsenosugar biosynthesis glycosyltransferase [Nitrosomonas sp.]|nr:MAG: TIGR04283 family arsenosugar biosynthesis glycosyltransferase [Nitrosomonas sp.]